MPTPEYRLPTPCAPRYKIVSDAQPQSMTLETSKFPGLRQAIAAELSPDGLFSSLVAGVVVGAIGVTMCISYAALIFSEHLAEFLTAGIGIAFFSAGIICAIVAVLSSSPAGMIAIPLPAAVPILALMVAEIGDRLPEDAPPDALFSSAIVAIGLTALITGVFLLILGLLKAGQLIRFIPYPVVGGFLAGVGWLLFEGGFAVTTGEELNWAQLPVLFAPDLLLRWLPALAFAIALLLLSRRYPKFPVLPVGFVVALASFYLILAFTDTSLATAMDGGWLLGPFPEGGGSWRPVGLETLKRANWSEIGDRLGDMGAITIITTLELLLTASSMELITNRDIDLNRELRAAGVANLLSGLGGGLVGSHVTSLSVLATKMGASRRLVALSAAAVFAVMLAVGISVLSLFPRVVLGGFLLLLGLSFLVEWLYDAWFELPKSDYFLVIVILLAIATFELLEGVAVGLVVAIVLFVINYSRIDVTKHTFSGTNRKSYVQRSRDQELLLQERGEQIFILELQGFIFFGTANKLLNQVRERLGAEDKPPLRLLVLDFRLVNGLDSSVVVSFAKLRQIAEKENLAIALTNLKPAVESQLKQGELLESEDSIFRVFADLDRGLEWCEDRLLEESELYSPRVSTLAEKLQQFIFDSQEFETFMGYLEQLKIETGDTLFQQGDPSDGLYFLESGRVSVVFELENGIKKRVQTYTSGTILGEMGLYQNAPRSASIIAEKNSYLYHLSTVAFEKIEAEQPQLARKFHKAIVRLLSERLKQRSAELQHLLQ